MSEEDPSRDPPPPEYEREDEGEDGQRAPPGDEALNEALTTLQDLLEKRSRQRRAEEQAEREGPATAEDADGQYSIPLLRDVVIPGVEGDAAPAAEGWDAQPPSHPSPSITDDELCRQAIERLTSEIEVIVQTGVDEALQQASKRIMRQVKNHIDITLPEILEEIARVHAGHRR